MTVLVTGGAGFIGSHLVDAVLAAGETVHIIDNLSSGKMQNVNPKAVFHNIDIRDRQLGDLLHDISADMVCHLAAQVSVPKSVADPLNDADINIVGSLNLLNACVASGIRRIVFSSSAAVYGVPKVLPIPEDHPLYPISPYGASKATAEQYLRLYAQQYNLEYIALRYANVYGPRQDAEGEGGVVSIFVDRVKKKEPLHIYGTGDQTRDFIYVKDVVDANLAALNCRANRTFNIGTQHSISVNDLVKVIEKTNKFICKTEYGSSRAGDILHSVLDIQHSLDELGWQPVYDIEAGIQAMADN